MKQYSENPYWLNNGFFPDLLENLPSHVFWKNKEGIYLGCNTIFARSLGMEKPEDVIGKSDYDFPVSKENSDSYRRDDQQVMISRQPKLNIEEKQIFNDGREAFLLTSKVPLFNKNNEVIGILGIYSDITELKKNQEALQQAKYQLEGAKLISGSIAHEIRTPLATIKFAMQGISNTLSKLISIYKAHKNDLGIKAVTDQEIKHAEKAINSVNKKVDQSNVVINMFLTKLQSIDFEFSEFSVTYASDCIQDAINEFIVPDNMINKISFNKDNDFKFLGNCILIAHVIMNLLKNAIYFILKANKGEITIWLEHHLRNNEIHFKDTGTGISPQVLPHIFNSFFTTESSTGTGIGLAFSKMVMQSHKGVISCKSIEGEYTEFVLSFPKLDNK